MVAQTPRDNWCADCNEVGEPNPDCLWCKGWGYRLRDETEDEERQGNERLERVWREYDTEHGR